MIKRIFLGPPLHWLLIILLAGVAWLAGLDRMHVSEFNLFISSLILITIGLIVLVIRSSPPGQQVTRDPFDVDDET